MPNSEHPIEWFLGRDGRQHGPLSDKEMRKLVELGHLRATDLVWRQGMANWVAAAVIIAELTPKAAPPQPAPAPPPPSREVPVAARVEPTPTPAPTSPAPSPISGLGVPPRAPKPAPAPEREPQPTTPAYENRGPLREQAPAPKPVAPSAPAPAAPPAARGPGYPNAPGPATGSSPTGPRAWVPPGGSATTPAAWQQATGEGAPQRQPPPPPNRAPPPGGQQGPPPASSNMPPPAAPHGPQSAPPPPAPRAADFNRSGPVSSSAPPPSPARSPSQAGPRLEINDGEGEASAAPRRRSLVKVAVALVFLSALGGTGVALHHAGYISKLVSLTNSTKDGSAVPVVRAPKEAMKEAPLKSFADTPQEVDAGFQKAPLWQLIKREFPDWYKERVTETVNLRAEKKDDKAIAGHLTAALIDLRRKNAASALAASPARLKFVASAFIENLVALQKQSVEACYGFISQGESSPHVVELLRSAEQAGPLQTQFTAIFEAVVDGRRAPRTNQQPKREDYDVLAQQLSERGWSPTDLQVFSDAAALARAQPAKVCQMVQDWFRAQLAVKDEATQLRLLVEALKPVVAG